MFVQTPRASQTNGGETGSPPARSTFRLTNCRATAATSCQPGWLQMKWLRPANGTNSVTLLSSFVTLEILFREVGGDDLVCLAADQQQRSMRRMEIDPAMGIQAAAENIAAGLCQLKCTVGLRGPWYASRWLENPRRTIPSAGLIHHPRWFASW